MDVFGRHYVNELAVRYSIARIPTVLVAMHNIFCRQARPQLRAFVRVYAQRELGPNDEELLEPIPARLEQTLEFQFKDSFEVFRPDGRQHLTPAIAIVGANPQAGYSIALKNGVESFGIFFQPTGLSRLFGIPMADLTGSSYDARDVLGNYVSSLHTLLAEAPSFEERVRLVENFLLKRVANVCSADRVMRAAAYIFAQGGAVRVADAACRHGVGLRHFEREFLQHIGIAPKLFARVSRFQTALDIKIHRPERRWVDIAHELGYHDQMHMVHDFHDLAGNSPARLLSMIGDARPPA
jgi:AraC-like DNA-binding protein